MMIKAYFVAALCILAAGLITMSYLKGRSDGRVEILNSTVRAYEKRSKVDNDTQNLGRFDLCLALGGVPDECAKLRGVEQAPKGK